MHIKLQEEERERFTPIIEIDGVESAMMLDFGLLTLKAGEVYECTEEKERAFLLIGGKVEVQVGDTRSVMERRDLFSQGPWVVHVGTGYRVVVTALTPAELAVEKTLNDTSFAPRIYSPGDCRSDIFGGSGMKGAAERTVRTVFDASNAPYSQMVLGEVINHPGKWSSYPPHDHPQPEIYHFRFLPANGFGFSAHGEDVVKVRHMDTVTLYPGKDHPQVAAPGYAMYYIWMIPHLPEARFGPDSRHFLDEHVWLLDEKAKIWSSD